MHENACMRVRMMVVRKRCSPAGCGPSRTSIWAATDEAAAPPSRRRASREEAALPLDLEDLAGLGPRAISWNLLLGLMIESSTSDSR